MRRVLSRLGLLAFGTLGAVVALEVVIRVAGLVAPFRPSLPGPDPSSASAEPPFVVLCVGDSHTWGDSKGFPAGLSQRLSELSPRYRVVNLGIPGTNTAQLRNRLPRYLDAYSPQVVVVWTGVNNHWNRAETESWTDAGISAQSFGDQILEASRVLRFFRVWRNNAALNRILAESAYVAEIDEERPGDPFRLQRRRVLGEELALLNVDGNTLSAEEVARVTALDLEAMIDLMQNRDIAVIVIGYPQPAAWYANANVGIRRATEATRTPEASTALARERVLARALREGRSKPTLIDATVHPTPIFYDAIAEVVLETMQVEGYLPEPGS